MKSYKPVQHFPLNTKGRDFVVGDVHGCFTLLEAELKARNFDPVRDRLFSVGDLIDRGNESPDVLEAVHCHQIKAVRGNHEQGILDWSLRGGVGPAPRRVQAVRDDPDNAIADWMFQDGLTSQLIYNEGQWFIELYCAGGARSDDAHSIVNYFASLPYAIEIETVHGCIGIVHAEVPCTRWSSLVCALEARTYDDSICELVLWGRRRWKGAVMATQIEGVTAVIAGHSPSHDVAQSGNFINIDTGAVYGNKLTILDLADVREWLARGDRPIAELPTRRPRS
ncbi:metallophosphoesterase [Paraburkholderia sediminicola]|uniref:metallophosphoesterase n=1 Tax=Paraburkholderia sediminicola TaxID=458836 RepID=UPI0038B9584D